MRNAAPGSPEPALDRRGELRYTALASTVYLLIALWAFRALLPVLGSSLPQQARLLGSSGQLGRWDQSMVVSVVIGHAHALLTHPTSLFTGGQCYPMPQAHTLGEHMLGTSLLATLPYLVTREPLAAYNLALLLSLWIPGITMYLLSREFVASRGAAFVAGLLFALEPVRLMDFGHPFVHADLWTPLVLLFLHRTITLASWRSAAALALFSALTLLESLYVVIGTSILTLSLAVFLVWRAPRAFLRSLPQLLACTALLLAVAWAIFAPYLQTRATWDVLGGRAGVPVPLAAFPLLEVATMLALLGALDRLRGPRAVRFGDPRASLLVGGLVVFWCGLGSVVVFGVALPSPLALLRGILPGLDAVRATGAIANGVGLVSSFLAGYAVLALTERLRPVPRVVLVSALALWVCAARALVPATSALFGDELRMGTWHARPADEDVQLLRATTGPILRLPFPAAESMKSLELADDLRLVSFDPRATSACYNSFPSPLLGQLQAITRGLPDPAAVDALSALGFRTALVRIGSCWPAELHRFERSVAALQGGPVRLVPHGRTKELAAYELVSATPVASDLRALLATPADASTGRVAATPDRATLAFPIVNHGRATFRLPAPIAPSDVLVRFRTDDGRVEERRQRVLLPLALAPGARFELPLDVQTPRQEGRYVAELALAQDPTAVLSTVGVDVAATAPPVNGAAAAR